MITLRFGEVSLEIHDGWSRAVFPDGVETLADHTAQPGQEERAQGLGYPSASTMNRDHDVVHCLLARFMGLPCSPTLHGVARGEFWPQWAAEEAAVLAVQRFALAAGIDLLALAKRHSD